VEARKFGNSRKFIRVTVTIPGELKAHVDSRKNSLEHAGNFSSYVRSLILKDKAEFTAREWEPKTA